MQRNLEDNSNEENIIPFKGKLILILYNYFYKLILF